MTSSNVLWQKDGSGSDNDVWDDRLLIEAYEKDSRMVSSALQSQNLGNEASMSGTGGANQMKAPKNPSAWKVGQFCRCSYAEDGLDYEAQVIKLLKPDRCRVRFLGYNNEEDKQIVELSQSNGNEARLQQKRDAEVDQNSEVEQSSEETASTSGRLLPPPPPSFFPDNLMSTNDDECLASMLMSWYMSGYHTGYYKAMKQFKCNCSCKHSA